MKYIPIHELLVRYKNFCVLNETLVSVKEDMKQLTMLGVHVNL